jgi:hypothetical protein
METGQGNFGQFLWRTTASHMIGYTVAGLFALAFMGYGTAFETGLVYAVMKPADTPITALGPALQFIPGAALALILYPFRGVFLSRREGWLRLLLLIGGLSLFNPQVPGPGNFEGLLYTNFSLAEHALGLPEQIGYSILFSGGLCLWHRRPGRAWNTAAAAGLVLIALMSLLGTLSALGLIPGA